MAKDDRLYGKFTLDFADNYKILPLSDKAFRCLVEATLWSRKQMSDGVLARRYAVARWGLDVLTELATNDQDKPSLIETADGWLIRDFAEHQDTRAEIEARSARNKVAGRRGGQAKAKRRAKQVASESLSESLAETETDSSTHLGSAAHVPDARAHPSRGANGPSVPIDGWTLVRQTIPTEHPQATRTALAIEAAELLTGGTPDADVIAALELWLTKPRAGPKMLPHLLSDVIKARSGNTAAAAGPATSKAQGWLDIANAATGFDQTKAIEQ